MSDKKEVVTKDTKVKTKAKRPNFFVRMGRGIVRGLKSMGSELKKVSWPTFGKSLKQTGIVLGVVMFFAVIITVFDLCLQGLLTLIV